VSRRRREPGGIDGDAVQQQLQAIPRCDVSGGLRHHSGRRGIVCRGRWRITRRCHGVRRGAGGHQRVVGIPVLRDGEAASSTNSAGAASTSVMVAKGRVHLAHTVTVTSPGLAGGHQKIDLRGEA